MSRKHQGGCGVNSGVVALLSRRSGIKKTSVDKHRQAAEPKERDEARETMEGIMLSSGEIWIVER